MKLTKKQSKLNGNTRPANLLLVVLGVLAFTTPLVKSPLTPVFYGANGVTGDNMGPPPANLRTGNKQYRVVRPPEINGMYPYYSAHYTGDYYIASTPDYMSWGSKQVKNPDTRAGTAIRRVWIESILDTECFASKAVTSAYKNGAAVGTDAARTARNAYLYGIRNICVNCGVGGCERVDIQAKDGKDPWDRSATNGTVFRHPSYRDWTGYSINGADDAITTNPNTYRTETVTTVAVIDRTNYFLTAGTLNRGLVRYDINNNGSYAPLGYPGGNNRTNAAVDIFVIRPTPYAVSTRVGENHVLFDYTKMNNLKQFGYGTNSFGAPTTRDTGNLLGGYGDYIDWEPEYMYSCINPSYSTAVYCYQLNRVAGNPGGNAINVGGNYGVIGGVSRALVGIDESPFFAVAYENKIDVHSIERLQAGGAPFADGDGTNIANINNGGDKKFKAVASYWEKFDNTKNQPGMKDGAGVSANLDDQIWDMVYINTHPYAAGNNNERTYGNSGIDFKTYHRKYNIREGPNADNEIPVSNNLRITHVARANNINPCPNSVNPPPTPLVTDPKLLCFNNNANENGNWGDWNARTTPNVGDTNPRERLYFVTHDYGKTMWWHEQTADGSGGTLAEAAPATVDNIANFCHPFCRSCRYPFNFRWCTDKGPKNAGQPTCRIKGDAFPPTGNDLTNFDNSLNGKANQISNGKGRSEWIIPHPQSRFTEVKGKAAAIKIPPECYPWGYPENDLFLDSHGFHDLWQAGFKSDYYPWTWSGNSGVSKPWSTRPLLVNPPEADPLVSNAFLKGAPPIFVPVNHSISNGTYYTPPGTNAASDWWKWVALGILGALLLGLLLFALFYGNSISRNPVVREAVIQDKKPVIIKEEIIKKKRRPKVIEEVVEERVVRNPSRTSRSVIDRSVRNSFNPYQKSRV